MPRQQDEHTLAAQVLTATRVLRRDPENRKLREQRDALARQHRELTLSRHIADQLAKAPPLRDDQLDRLAQLIKPALAQREPAA